MVFYFLEYTTECTPSLKLYTCHNMYFQGLTRSCLCIEIFKVWDSVSLVLNSIPGFYSRSAKESNLFLSTSGEVYVVGEADVVGVADVVRVG